MAELDFTIDENGIGTLIVNRPHVRNAFNWATMEAFAELVEHLHDEADLRALIVTGMGKAFVSGGDLSELQHYPLPEHGERLAKIMGDALKRFEELPFPTIAAINGPARGGGAEVAMACDLRVIAEDATIGFVHSRLGIITAWGGGQRLLRTVGYARALELLTTGRILGASETLALGLVNGIAPEDGSLETAHVLAQQIATNPNDCIRATKRFLRVGLTEPEPIAFAVERAEFPALWDTEFRRKAVQKFLNKANN
ncbi:MAG: enoyl-CoA hydratase/isomerase family protein [Anaerolineales bacterium]|nr:enoyl-CoA hydratase/isomerase family protein [Anaerolineales bacterium]